jgi:hypothetical protein
MTSPSNLIRLCEAEDGDYVVSHGTVFRIRIKNDCIEMMKVVPGRAMRYKITNKESYQYGLKCQMWVSLLADINKEEAKVVPIQNNDRYTNISGHLKLINDLLK